MKSLLFGMFTLQILDARQSLSAARPPAYPVAACKLLLTGQLIGWPACVQRSAVYTSCYTRRHVANRTRTQVCA